MREKLLQNIMEYRASHIIDLLLSMTAISITQSGDGEELGDIEVLPAVNLILAVTGLKLIGQFGLLPVSVRLISQVRSFFQVNCILPGHPQNSLQPLLSRDCTYEVG
jgi:hypothetical protein